MKYLITILFFTGVALADDSDIEYRLKQIETQQREVLEQLQEDAYKRQQWKDERDFERRRREAFRDTDKHRRLERIYTGFEERDNFRLKELK